MNKNNQRLKRCAGTRASDARRTNIQRSWRRVCERVARSNIRDGGGRARSRTRFSLRWMRFVTRPGRFGVHAGDGGPACDDRRQSRYLRLRKPVSVPRNACCQPAIAKQIYP
jgi:hypothetical protein